MKTCKDAAKEKRSLPVGVSDYVRAQAEYYYVDKTLLIKEFLDRKPLVSLFTRIRGLLQTEFGRHMELLESDRLADYEKVFFAKIVDGSPSEVELSSSLENLSKMLDEHYKTPPIIIIDEYDTPIQEGYSKNFYEEIVGFMRIFFSGAFKDNKHLAYGF